MNKGDTVISFIIVLFLSYVHFNVSRTDAASNYYTHSWAEQVLSKMTLEEKIAQTLMPMACVDGEDKDFAQLERELEQYNVGGIILFQNKPRAAKRSMTYDVAKQVQFVNRCQSMAKYPLLVGIDAEWGLGMRFNGAMTFPRNMTLGALSDDTLVFDVGKEIGRQCRSIGAHINFAPVVDINSNPRNPIIGNRSFGDNTSNIIRKSLKYAQGMKQSGIIACVKHFPGHGDTEVDSHKQLPIVKHSKEVLWKRELVPFREVFKKGIESVMVAHLHVQAYQPNEVKPASLSREIVSDLLKKQLSFSGLIFSDAFSQMKAITDHYRPGQAEAEALRAGIDIIVDSTDVGKAIENVKKALYTNKMSFEELDTKVLKILKTKESLRLHRRRFTKIPKKEHVFSADAYQLRQKIYKQALTLMNGEDKQVKEDAVVVCIGDKQKNTHYSKQLPSYIRSIYLPFTANQQQVDTVLNTCLKAKKVVLALFPKQNRYGNVEAVSPTITQFLNKMKKYKNKVITGVFANPYVLNSLDIKDHNLVIAYEDSNDALKSFFEAITTAYKCHGKNPVPHAIPAGA